MPRNKTQRIHQSYARLLHDRLDKDFDRSRVPRGWHSIWADEDHRADKATKVTILVDADVLRFFRAMGAGYGPRMNRVLRAFMHDRLAGSVDGPEDGMPADPDAELTRLENLLADEDRRRAMRIG